MTPCPACADSASGVYLVGCRGCTLRHIAGGPEFFESLRAGRLTSSYKRVLTMRLGGIDAHAEVREAAKALRMGSVPA